ncbi:MAG: class I adenylate-forming enzyme family protein [Acidimicrobiales bacterium]
MDPERSEPPERRGAGNPERSEPPERRGAGDPERSEPPERRGAGNPERMTVAGLVLRWAALQPDVPFVITDVGVLTYGQLEQRSRTVLGQLLDRGVGKGTRVGLMMPNCIDWAVIAVATARAGAVLVPLSTLLRPPELEAQLRVAGVEQLLLVRTFRGRDYVGDLAEISPGLSPGCGQLFDERLPRLRRVDLCEDLPARLDPADGPEPSRLDAADASVRPADDLVIIFTSGSRGAPKGVVHTHGGALGATEAGLAARCLGHGDRLYIPMPFFWVGGYGTGLLSVLVCGATLISEAQPEPERTLQLLERERVTLFRGWPGQASSLAAHPRFADADLSSLRAGSLEAVLPPTRRGAPGTRAALLGMTESFGPYCGYPLDRGMPPGKEGSCGTPFADVEVRVVDIDSGETVARGFDGEIQIRGRNMMRSVCGRRRSEVFTVDGFYPTGDLGHLDDDGFLFFRGRRDDMFKVSGATVYPSEVESALSSIAVVERAHVVDVDDGGTTRVGAAVVLAEGEDRSPEDLAKDLHRTLSSFKIPTRWRIVGYDDLPMTATGKVDKEALRRLLSGATSGDTG